MWQILIVEDEEDLARITQVHLTRAGYASDIASTCAQARELVEQNSYDLILLDMLLPDNTGNVLCEYVRSLCNCPIIFLSCLDDSDTIISALHSGGDDYVTKPVRYEELLARIEANIRRARAHSKPSTAGALRRLNSFAIDMVRRRVIQQENEVELSSIEYGLLLHMVENPDSLLLYEDLYRQVWNGDCLGDVRTVMVHISNLRKKIDPERKGIIETVRGAGYIFSNI